MRRNFIPGTIGAIGLAASVAAGASAEDQPPRSHGVQIASMSLDQSLHAIAYQFGAELLYTVDEVGGIEAKPPHEAYTAQGPQAGAPRHGAGRGEGPPRMFGFGLKYRFGGSAGR